MTKHISLGHGRYTTVDDEDYEFLSRWKWCYQPRGYGYAARSSGRSKTFHMHRVIMNAPKGLEVDHINGDGLDNRRSNLRLCTKAQNQYNQRPKCRGTSQFKGVSWKTTANRWVAQIQVNGRKLFLGYFQNETEAAQAYDQAARQLFGEFARPNIEAGIGDD